MGLQVDLVALVIAGLHIARFLADFLLTYEFYYPTEPLPEVPPASSGSAA
jgi:hypothetical protein